MADPVGLTQSVEGDRRGLAGESGVRIEALRASQRLVLEPIGSNDNDSSIMVGEEDERWASYTTLTDSAVPSPLPL